MKMFPRLRIASEADEQKVTSPSTSMALALAHKADRSGTPIYAGTVFGEEKRRRRVKGKAQRQARKIHRGRR